jgi:fumarate reductase flavoprotein subunit
MVLDQQFDLVVVGAGGAGLPAAVEAIENGLTKILIMEKRAQAGGNAAMAWGIFAAESPLQKEEMVEARRETLFKAIMDWSHWKTDPAILRAYIWKSGETIRWLEEKGLKFDLLRYFPGQEPAVWHVPEGHGARMMEVLSLYYQQAGGQLSLNTRCTQIVLDAGGGVKAITAEKDGQIFTVQTRNVIIASGGFGGNRAMLEKYCDGYDSQMHCLGLPHQGDGVAMGMEAGAATASLGSLLLEWPHVKGDSGSILVTVAREPYCIYINKKGQRFIDEVKGLHSFECANGVMRQPQKAGYIIADEGLIKRLEERGAVLGRGNDRAGRRRKIPGLKDQIKAIAAKNPENILITDSWEEIAAWSGASAPVLIKTLEDYNQDCERGCDQQFFKDPRYLAPLVKAPFYAIKGELVFLNTLGGLKINARMEVLDKTEKPIKGLYAAGADTGSWEPDTYFDRFSGTALGFAVNSGRIAGLAAAGALK